MIKRFAKIALIYAIIAMVLGVFYREFTKGMDFNGKTNLSILHTHYFMLGMFFFILLALLEKNFSFSNKLTFKLEILYHIGLNITGVMFFTRGLVQVIDPNSISNGINAMISGVAGIGHIVLGISILCILIQWIKSLKKENISND